MIKEQDILAGHLVLAATPWVEAEKRFKFAFKVAWGRIPLSAQINIAEYLRARPAKAFLCYEMDFCIEEREPFGRCLWHREATPMTFLAPFLELSSEADPVISIVGHELTHVFRQGAGLWVPDGAQEEAETRAQGKQWGFGEPNFIDREHFNEMQVIVDEWRESNSRFRHLTEAYYLLPYSI